jgi:chromosome condensin MukBEF ATPase and DNA-binding subunit MukB
MSGMQDVTALADRYTNLSLKSQKLHRNIQRLKQEVTSHLSVIVVGEG